MLSYCAINTCMQEQDRDQYIQRAKKIEEQVERWDLFAKIVPTIFLALSFIFLALGIISFDTLFYVGIVLFAITAVVWWFWTIFSIRFLVRLLRRASINLLTVSTDLKKVRKDFYENEENNSGKHN